MTATDIMNPSPTQRPIVDSGFPRVPTRIREPGELVAQDPAIPEVLERLEALELHLARIHRVCSEAYASQSRYEAALRHQSIAVELDDTSLEYRNQRGYLRYLTGDDGCSEDFEWVVRNDGKNSEAWFNLGMVCFGKGDVETAERCFASAAQCRSNDPEIWNNLGVARWQLGRPGEARACFEKALAIEPTNGDALANLKATTGTV
jgi:tetratricopeptide (TPR) repeat protein